MDVKQVLKDFNSSVQEFERQKSRESLIQNLQILSATNDLAMFDTGSFEGSEFYNNLYDLLTHQGTDPELLWCIVSVLEMAVRNPSARSALVHTYHFLHPLTMLLDSQLTSERKSTILNIIQELSYGVVISWQEAHLPTLIGSLVAIVMDEDGELVPQALGALVNLCHKNRPAIVTLMNCIEIKSLIRRIISLQRDNVETSVQVCKLLMVLDQLSGNVPDAEILTFVKVSFLRINKAFTCGNLFLMRHIVHFFRDAKESEHGRKVLLTYPKYQEEVNKLITTLKSKEEPGDWQCVQQLVDFLRQLVDLELLAIVPLFTRLTQCLLQLVQMHSVVPNILELFSVMLRQSRNTDEQEYKSMCSCLESQLQMFIEMLHNGCKADSSKSEVQDMLIGLLHLFHELAVEPSLCSVIASSVDKEQLKNLLLPLMSLRSSDESRLFQNPLIVVYVEVLSFVYELSLDDKEWLFLYSDLLQKKQILKLLAIALYSGSYEVKKQILFLAGTTSFSNKCLTGLSKCLSDLNQLFLFSSPPKDQFQEKSLHSTKSQIDYSPFFSKAQSDSLNSLIDKLDDLCAKNKIQDASLAGIIELYNYKLSEMRRAERSLQCNLEAADKHRAQLSHRVAQLSAETGRLHQLLYTGQQTVEGCQLEVQELRSQLCAAQEAASSSHIKFKQLKQDVQSKSMIIKEQSEDISKMKKRIEDQEKRYAELKEKAEELENKIENQNKLIQELETEKSDLQAVQAKLEEKLKVREQTIVEKEMIVEKKSSQVQTLEQEISKQLGLIKGLEKTVKEKDKEINAQKKELLELERQRKLIFEITGGKKNNL